MYVDRNTSRSQAAPYISPVASLLTYTYLPTGESLLTPAATLLVQQVMGPGQWLYRARRALSLRLDHSPLPWL